MIEVRRLSHRYPGAAVNALNEVSLSIGAGEALGLLGPNGAGKTTLMSLLAGLTQPQSGEILFEGTPIEKLSDRRRREISLVPQDFAFYPLLSVWDNMRYFAALYQERDRKFLDALLDRTDLQAHRKKAAKNLSGGLKRRLNFAIGLINRPKLIFLDEITVGIDPESRRFILDSVARLTGEGVTVIYTSHYLQEIEQLCPNIALLSEGRLIHQGKVGDILAAHAERQWHIRTAPPLSPEHAAALSGSLNADNSAVLPPTDFAALSDFLQRHGYTLTACRFGHASLEQFYLDFLRNPPPC